jgi:hypothetical protein
MLEMTRPEDRVYAPEGTEEKLLNRVVRIYLERIREMGETQ